MKGLERLRDDELVGRMAGELVAAGGEGWIVGGAVRDALLRRPGAPDLDLLIPFDSLGFARRLADVLGGAFVALDEARGIARVVVGEGAGRREIDVAGLRAPSVDDDLRQRDFTVNALAVALKDLAPSGARTFSVLDVTGGQEDLGARRVRVPSPAVLDDDPLRLLRAVRLAAELDFTIEPKTREAVTERAGRLADVSGERVQAELVALFAVDPAWPWVEEMDRLGLLAVMVPEQLPMVGLDQGRYHEATLWDHSLATLRHLEETFKRLDQEFPDEAADLGAYFAVPLEAKATRCVLAKWAALWHDLGKPATRTVDPAGEVHFLGHEKVGVDLIRSVARRLRFGRRARTFLSRVVAHHLRPLHLSKAEAVTRRACYRFFRDLEDAALAVCLVALADAKATREGGDLATDVEGVFRTLLAFRRAQAATPSPPLLSGREIMARYGLDEGPLVGRLLGLVEEARAAGEVETKGQAFAYLDARRNEWGEAL